MSVGLVCKSVVICSPLCKVTLTLRNDIDVLDYSAVNLMVGCMLLISSKNCLKHSSPCGQITNTSSMYQ